MADGVNEKDPRESDLISSLSNFCGGSAQGQSEEAAVEKSIAEDINQLTIEIEQTAFMVGFRLEPLIKEVEDNHQILSFEFDYQGPEYDKLNPIECFFRFNMVLSPAMTDEQLDELLSFSAGAEGKLSKLSEDEIAAIGSTSLPNVTDEGVLDMPEPIEFPVKAAPENAQPTTPAEAAKTTANDKAKPARTKGELIKVNSLKLDRLVDDVGEMISLKSQLKSLLQENKDRRVQKLLKEFDKSLNNLRDVSLSLRLIPLFETLSRFHRVVREAAKMTEKSIHLEVIGGQTELDRVTVEKLVDPLTHIVRNSCDHGIESPEQRIAAGKNDTGTVTIHAQYKGAGVSIKVMDDGKGLDKDKIFAKAVSSGIVNGEDELSDKEIFQLIFHPGLSTAEKVTDLSGRGVGMDVVRRNINDLGGDVHIDSQVGKGTTLDIRLPLTTAILDGFMVRIGDADLEIQMDNIIECMRREELSQRMVKNQSCIELRGGYIPVVYLSQTLQVENRESEPEGLMVDTQFGAIVLAVDYLVGELQTVVKPLDPILKQSQLFSGIVKVSDGDIGFVLDINRVAATAERNKLTHYN